jgi:hypothetical protein
MSSQGKLRTKKKAPAGVTFVTANIASKAPIGYSANFSSVFLGLRPNRHSTIR